jgi:hypothetical protein
MVATTVWAGNRGPAGPYVRRLTGQYTSPAMSAARSDGSNYSDLTRLKPWSKVE